MAIRRSALLNFFFISVILDATCGKLSFIHYSNYRPKYFQREISYIRTNQYANAPRKTLETRPSCGINPLPFQYIICAKARKKATICIRMTATSSSEATDSLPSESVSNVDVCMVVPGQHDVRELADLCCRSFYGEHQWWSSLLNPISGMQRIILFEKVLADLSNRLWKHQSEGCGSLHLAINKFTGEAIGTLFLPQHKYC
jgi:hypothetical protein